MDNPARAQAYREFAQNHRVERVLDVGCGAGQELLVFVKEFQSVGVGVDIAPEVGGVGRKLFEDHAPGAPAYFVRAVAEYLPFPAQSFDVVISRLALPYTHNAKALAEFSRVLKPNGILLLKIHHARFYLRRFGLALQKMQIPLIAQYGRVLLNGSLYFLTGSQPLNLLGRRETFQTQKMLRRELNGRGMTITGHFFDSGPTTPFLVIEKKGN